MAVNASVNRRRAFPTVRVKMGFGGIRPVQAQQNRVNRLMFREAERVAKTLDGHKRGDV